MILNLNARIIVVFENFQSGTLEIINFIIKYYLLLDIFKTKRLRK